VIRDRQPVAPDVSKMDLHGEFVPDDVTAAEARDEVNYRARQAGYPVTRDGKPVPRLPTMINPWGRAKLNVWPRDEHGNLIE